MNSKQCKNLVKSAWIAAILAESLLILYYAVPLIMQTPSPFLAIQTDSMLPVIKPGNIVIIQGLQNATILNDKIIAYYNPTQGRIAVHRVIAENGKVLITKGDNSEEEDFFQPSRDFVLGEVKYIIKI